MPRVKKKYQGRAHARYGDNPREKKAALAWQRINEQTGGPCRRQNITDNLLADHSEIDAVCTPEQQRDANTVIQWLGSPFGFSWLLETFGDEIHAEVERRRKR